MSWIGRLQEAKVGAVQRREPVPWLGAVTRALPPKIETISTRSICNLIDVEPTTGNARKVSAVMKTLGYVPIKSRRLAPGGFRDSTIRGWARPLRETKLPCPTGSSPAGAAGVEPRGGCHVTTA
jgi:hypothetical protein